MEAIQLVREQRENRSQEVSYFLQRLTVRSLRAPSAPAPKDQLAYTRRNGSFLLEIGAHPRFGLPYGQGRLIPIWMATLAQKRKSRVIHFDSPTQLLEYFRLPKDGAQYQGVGGPISPGTRL